MITKVSLTAFRPKQPGKPSRYALRKTYYYTKQLGVEWRLQDLRNWLIENGYHRFPAENKELHSTHVVLESSNDNGGLYREYWKKLEL